MANLAELYIRLDPYEASEGDYEFIGEHIHETAIALALRTYGGGVTVEVVISAGSARVRVRVLQALVAFDLLYGHMADWKGFKEQAVATYDASVVFLKEMADAVPRIAHAHPHQVKRVEKRYRASGKVKELAESIERLRLVEKRASKVGVQPLLRHIQVLAAQLEQI